MIPRVDAAHKTATIKSKKKMSFTTGEFAAILKCQIFFANCRGSQPPSKRPHNLLLERLDLVGPHSILTVLE